MCFVFSVVSGLTTYLFIEEKTTIWETKYRLEVIKKECEMSLPRDKFCEIVMTAKPKEEE